MNATARKVTAEVATFGPASYRQVNGLHVLHLKGDDYEMGRQHGALLSHMVPEGPIPYYRSYVERIVGSGRGSRCSCVSA